VIIFSLSSRNANDLNEFGAVLKDPLNFKVLITLLSASVLGLPLHLINFPHQRLA
jgi:hypothetical protein